MSIPSSIDYTSILPMAVESRVRRRGYVPSNGASFVSDNNNIIEIPVQASAFLDTRHSFLRFNMLNTTGQTFGVDFGGGHGFISRLRVLQSGTVLSDCRSYGRLMSSIILPCQTSETSLASRSIKEGQRYGNSAVAGGLGNTVCADFVVGGASANAEVTGACVNTPTNAVDSTCAAAAGSNYVFSIPLMNGLLGTTQEKLVPLFLLNAAPIVIEITLAPALDVGVYGGVPAAGYTINDVRYMASLVETGPAVEDQIRMVQAQSNGRLVLNGVDYTHTPGNIPNGTVGRVQIPIPVRKKSIKSVLFVGAGTAYGGGAGAQNNRFNLSFGGHMFLSEYQLSFGSRRIPDVPIGTQFLGAVAVRQFKAQYFEELSKCFGETKSASGLGVMSRVNNSNRSGLTGVMSVPSPGGAAMSTLSFCPFGIDCESFQPDGKGGGALESGIDTASSSTPLSLDLDIGVNNAAAIQVDVFVVHDSIYFIDQVGNLRVAL